MHQLRLILAAVGLVLALPVAVFADEGAGLTSGTYEGVWQNEDGVAGRKYLEITIDGESIVGVLTMENMEDGYDGDDITGKIRQNGDGSLAIACKTKDGKMMLEGTFDGQVLIGTFDYRVRKQRLRERSTGQWAAQKAADAT